MLASLTGAEIHDLRERSSLEHPDAIYTAVGGARVREADLASVQDAVRSVAVECGYPEPQQRGGYQQFDVECARQLIAKVQIVPAEAAKTGVWQYLCCIVLPDVVRWRFFSPSPGTAPERFLGGVRNALGRLWWRAYVLEGADGLFRSLDLMGRLSEEELVQLFERPTLAGSRPLVRATALAFLEIVEAGFQQRQKLMRDAQKRIMRLASFISFDGLEPHELGKMIAETFALSARSITGQQRRSG